MDDEQDRLAGRAGYLHGDDLQFTASFVGPDVTPTGSALVGGCTGCSHVGHDIPGGAATDAVLACSLREPDLHLAILSDNMGAVEPHLAASLSLIPTACTGDPSPHPLPTTTWQQHQWSVRRGHMIPAAPLARRVNRVASSGRYASARPGECARPSHVPVVAAAS